MILAPFAPIVFLNTNLGKIIILLYTFSPKLVNLYQSCQVYKTLYFYSTQGKSVVVTRIHNLRSENVTLDEEIEEQKRRNSLLMKRIADAKEQLNTIQQNAANLYNECQSTDETSERFSKQLDQEKRKLSETVTKKRSEISEIKGDAELVTTLREEKDRSVADIARLRDDVTDADIDVDNLTIKFQYELGKMVLFPFWKLEEEIDKSLLSCDINSCVDESSKEHVVDINGNHYHQKKVCSLIRSHIPSCHFFPF